MAPTLWQWNRSGNRRWGWQYEWWKEDWNKGNKINKNIYDSQEKSYKIKKWMAIRVILSSWQYRNSNNQCFCRNRALNLKRNLSLTNSTALFDSAGAKVGIAQLPEQYILSSNYEFVQEIVCWRRIQFLQKVINLWFHHLPSVTILSKNFILYPHTTYPYSRFYNPQPSCSSPRQIVLIIYSHSAASRYSIRSPKSPNCWCLLPTMRSSGSLPTRSTITKRSATWIRSKRWRIKD